MLFRYIHSHYKLEKPGQYGFELALNVLVLQASNKNGERK
jgi:hypothetical protein